MNFAALKQELSDRGFAHLSDPRLGTMVNQGRAELDRMFLWPYREKSATGTSPLVISDLDQVEKVINTSQSSAPLAKVDYSSLVDWYGDLSRAGTPSCYYIAWPNGTPEVATYPVSSSDVIGVQYWRFTPQLVNPGDTPLAPVDFHGLYVDIAVRKAYRDIGRHSDAESIETEITDQVQHMLNTLTPGTADGPDAYVGVTFASSDW